MTAPGKLIAVEGIDGSGKRTQVERLALALKARGYSIYSTGFPQYESWFGKMVGQFLNGDLDRKSTRLNSSHGSISYAVFCLKKKNHNTGKTARALLTGPSPTRGGERLTQAY